MTSKAIIEEFMSHDLKRQCKEIKNLPKLKSEIPQDKFLKEFTLF